MWKPIILLCASNLFMTMAWYGHLKFKNKALWLVILASWGIAFLNTACKYPQTVLAAIISRLRN